jgi:hypothetical protein
MYHRLSSNNPPRLPLLDAGSAKLAEGQLKMLRAHRGHLRAALQWYNAGLTICNTITKEIAMLFNIYIYSFFYYIIIYKQIVITCNSRNIH